MYIINIFISHSWSYSEHYQKLYEWIFENNWHVGGQKIIFKDKSIPKDSPIHTKSDQVLMREIKKRINMSDVVVILTGVYSTYSRWINKEISASKELNIPILAVNPWGQKKKSSVVMQNADETVNWNKKSVINGIWDLYKRSKKEL